MKSTTQAQGWHTVEWGTWGWAETILKLIGLAFGVLAFFRSNPANELVVGNNPHLAAVVIVAILTLFSVGQVGIRFTQKEIVSMIFAVLNFLGHAALLVAMLRVPTDLTLPVLFGVFYALGGIVKVQFLRVTGYTEGGADSRTMLIVAALMALPYIIFVVLLLV